MLQHLLKIDLRALLPTATQSPSDTQEHSRRRARANRRGRAERENSMSIQGHDFACWMSSGVVLTTARVASGV